MVAWEFLLLDKVEQLSGDNLWILAQNFPMIYTQPRPQKIKSIEKST